MIFEFLRHRLPQYDWAVAGTPHDLLARLALAAVEGRLDRAEPDEPVLVDFD